MPQDILQLPNVEWACLCCFRSPANALTCMHGRFLWENCHNGHARFGWHIKCINCESPEHTQDSVSSHGLCVAGIIIAPQGVNVQPQGINIQPTVGLSVSLLSVPSEAQNFCLKGISTLPWIEHKAKTCRHCLLRLARRIRQLWRKG
jgi:hypothetical protein